MLQTYLNVRAKIFGELYTRMATDISAIFYELELNLRHQLVDITLEYLQRPYL